MTGVTGRAGGFTLIELIMVIVLLGAVVAVTSVFIVQPFQAFDDVRRRARLVDRADQALGLMHRELRNALPNSVRVRVSGDRVALEFLRITLAGRYRAARGAPGDDPLAFGRPDTSFDVMGTLDESPAAAGEWLVVYNLTATGCTANADPNAYCGGADNRAAIGSMSTANRVRLAPAFAFPYASPQQRFYVVDTAISYVCDRDTGEIRRYEGYGITPTQPVAAGDFNTAPALVAGGVSACVFAYDDGAGTRNGLVTARLTVAESGESVSLNDQAHVLNAP